MPVHHLLERILDEYIVAAGLQSGQPLFAENALALISPPGLSFRSPAQVTFAHDAHHQCERGEPDRDDYLQQDSAGNLESFDPLFHGNFVHNESFDVSAQMAKNEVQSTL